MQRQELPNNTPEQVRGYLDFALGAVEAVDPPDDLREAVFTQACQLIASKQVILTQPQQVPIDLARLGIKGH